MAGDRPLTTTEAAAGLGVSRSTVKNWIKEFSLGAMRDARGDWRITPDALPIFEEVKRLRDEGLGLESIRRVIGAPMPTEPIARPGLVTRFQTDTAVSYDDPSQACEVMADEAPLQILGAAIESQERLAMQMGRLAHANGQLQAQLKYVSAETPRLQQHLEQALERGAQFEARLSIAAAERESLELALAEKHAWLEERDARIAWLEQELAVVRARVEELASAKPRSGMHYHFGAPSEDVVNTQLVELQKDLVKAKERIAAYEAEDDEDARRPWWNFWD